MPVIARLTNLRIAPRKVRLVANMLKGMPVDEAVSQLRFMSKATARPLQKLLQTAAADAEHNYKLVKDDLVVKSILVNSAQTLKRYMPRAFGRAGLIRKRGSNVIVTIESKTGATISEAEVKATEKEKEARKTGQRTEPKRAVGDDGGAVKKASSKRGTRLFNRRIGEG